MMQVTHTSVHLIYAFSRYSYNVTVIITINKNGILSILYKRIDKKDIGLCTEQIIILPLYLAY